MIKLFVEVLTFSRQRRIWSFHFVVLQRTAKKGTTNSNSRVQPLFSLSNLLCSVVSVAIAVFMTSLIVGKASGELGHFLLLTSYAC